MAIESPIYYPKNRLTEISATMLPENHEQLLELMVEHANMHPTREVGGRTLTDQRFFTASLIRVTGNRSSVGIPRFTHARLRTYRGWDTMVVYHSHTPGEEVAFSRDDVLTYKSDVKHLSHHLKISNRPDGFYALFDYVININGEFAIQSVAFELANFSSTTFSIKPVTLVPEKPSLVY